MNGLKRALSRFVIKKSKDNRPGSFPYISGDTFRCLSDHIYEDENLFNPDQNIQKIIFVPENVKNGDKVFVDTRSIKYFFSVLHPKILNPYILITHNSDLEIGHDMVDYIDEKIIKWLAQNVTIKHPKIIPIPIGLENLYYYNNGITKYFDRLRKRNVEKKDRVLYGFSITNNPTERLSAYNNLQINSLFDEIKYKYNNINYLKLLSKYKFVASPSGNGLDCHRTWEAMYLRTVPIVKRSVAMEYFYSIGLPVWIIDDWQDLKGVSELFLENKYNESKDRFDCSALFADYWVQIFKF